MFEEYSKVASDGKTKIGPIKSKMKELFMNNLVLASPNYEQSYSSQLG